MAVTINGSTGLTGVAAIDSVSSTELGYVDGVTSAIQTQMDGKASYETGTFTPALSGATFTYSDRAARYTKVGNCVTVWGSITATYTSGSGAFYVNNLPFTVVNDSSTRGGAGAVSCVSGVTFTGYVTCEPYHNTKNLYFEANGSNASRTDLGSSHFASGGFTIRFTAIYQAA